jgi:hypothetical protein
MAARRITREFGRALLAFSFLVTLSATASADWQGTTWGMSESEANSALLIPHQPASEKEKQESFGHAKITFDYSVGDFNFGQNVLLFNNNKLTGIMLTLTNGGSDCEKLISVMRRKYGAPSIEQVKSLTKENNIGIHDVTWEDVANHNQIRVILFQYITTPENPECHITYVPYIVPKPGQL